MLKIPVCLTLYFLGNVYKVVGSPEYSHPDCLRGAVGEAHRGEGPLVALSAEAMSRGPPRPGWGGSVHSGLPGHFRDLRLVRLAS